MNNSLFGLSVDAIGAFNQICCLLGALLCLAIGGFLMGNALYWRLHAKHVTGTIAGVRERGGFYYSVYQYTLADGQTFEATSDTGSSSATGNETGKTLSLLVFPSHPDQARRAGNYMFEIIGLFFAAPGAFFLYLACTAWPVTKMTAIVLAAMSVYAIVRMHGILLPKEKRMPTLSGIMQMKNAAERQSSDAMRTIPVQRMEDLPDLATQNGKMAQQAKNGRTVGIVFILLGPALLAGGIYSGHQIFELTRTGLRTPGTVTGLQSEWSNHNTIYHALVDFRDATGTLIHFKDGSGSNPPMYRPGEAVTVLYLPEKPQKSATIDRGIGNWLPPVLLTALGIAMFFGGIALRRQKPPAP